MQSGIAGTVDGQAASRISPAAEAFAKARGISRATLEQAGVASGTTFFRDLKRDSEALFFRYPQGWKARSIEAKEHMAGGGWKLAFWNIDKVLKGSAKVIYITEGEPDALALIEAGLGVDQVLSVPNGARDPEKDKGKDPKDAPGYAYVEEALKAGLSRAEKFVWCGDSDGPGHFLRSHMARLLGVARFWTVDWPEGTKDANDFLKSDGGDALYELAVRGCIQWPVAGIYRLNELPEPPKLTLWRPGFAEWESKVLLAPRTLSVVTGHPGHGKTQLWGQIWFQVVRSYCVPACVASFETRAKPHIRRQLRSLFIGKLEKELNEEEIARADAWINERYLFLVHPEQRPTLEWFLDMAEVAVVRHGARIIQLDPWNRLEATIGQNETKTDYVGRCLRSLHAFAHDMNVHVQILAHPAKMDSARKGKPPSLEDIADSKNWENMIDQGFVVHRPEMFDENERKTEATMYCLKARFEELGHPCKLGMDYDLTKGAYKSTDYKTGAYSG